MTVWSTTHLLWRAQPLVFAVLAQLTAAMVCQGGVVVISNHTTETIRFTATTSAGEKVVGLDQAELAPLESRSPILVRWEAGDERGQRTVELDSAYLFERGTKPGRVLLNRVSFDERGAPDGPAVVAEDQKKQAGEQNHQAVEPAGGQEAAAELTVFTVKLLVDDEERASRGVWEARLRKRLQAASSVFERCCAVRFKTVAIDVWRSDNRLTKAVELREQFSRDVDCGPAQLAIGFTSQFELPQVHTQLDSLSGPFESYLLLPERSPRLSEADRIELLVHELGHYLGAAHSAEADSVMRPTLVDGRARSKGFRVRFDPLNALAICLTANEAPSLDRIDMAALRAPTRQRLAGIYATLDHTLRGDPVAQRYLSLVGGTPSAPRDPASASDSSATAVPVFNIKSSAAAATGQSAPHAGQNVSIESPVVGNKSTAEKSGLLSLAQLEYQGTFRVPLHRDPADREAYLTFAYGGRALAYDPSADTLYLSSHEYRNRVAELTIPVPSTSPRIDELPRADFKQYFANVMGDLPKSSGFKHPILGGLLIDQGRLLWTVYEYYDATGTAKGSHGVSSLTLSEPEPRGLFRLHGAKSGEVAGYMCHVPPPWDTKLGRCLTGLNGVPIAARTSLGPCAAGFDPTQLEKSAACDLYISYPVGQALPRWARGDRAAGMAFIDNTVLFLGTAGIGRYWYGAAEKPPPGLEMDRYRHSKGSHSPPYKAKAWLYSAASFLAVKHHKASPASIRPYHEAILANQWFDDNTDIGSLAFDAANRRLFVVQQHVETVGGDRLPVIHVFLVSR